MKKRTVFIGVILSFIPLGQPLIFKTGLVLSTSSVMLSLTEKVNANGAENPFKSANFYANRAGLKYDKEDFYGALIDINKAIRKNKKNSNYVMLRGAIYGRLGQYYESCLDYYNASSMGNDVARNSFSQLKNMGVC